MPLDTAPGTSRRALPTFAGAGIAALGLAAFWLWPPAAVALTLVGTIIALGGAMMVNLPATLTAFVIAVALHSVAVAWTSGRTELGVVPFATLIAFIPPPGLIRRLGYKFSNVAHGLWIVALALFVALRPSWPGAWAAVPSLVLGGLWLLSALGGAAKFRKLAKPDWNLKRGEEVPDFELPDRLGRGSFRLSDERGRYVLLCFLRGDWCPVCRVKMRIFQADAPELARHNLKLVAISPSAGADAEELARSIGCDYTLLVDPANDIASRFGAIEPKAKAGKDAPLPVSFLIDPEGRLQHGSKPDDVASFLDPRRIVPLLKLRTENRPA